MEVASRLVLLDRHSGRREARGIGDALVTQWIEFGCDHECRREMREIPTQR